MRILFAVSLWLAALASNRADDAILPAPLNSVLPRIIPGMRMEEVRAVLTTVYPRIVYRPGFWSGMTGSFTFSWETDCWLFVPAIFNSRREKVVSDDLVFTVHDAKNQRSFEIRRLPWNTSPPSREGKKG